MLVSRATFTIAMATPECTVPTTTSTFSRPTRRFMLSVAASGFELVIDLHERDRASAELAALLLDVETEAVVDELAELRERARVRQHEADLQRRALGDRRHWQMRCGSLRRSRSRLR